MQITKTYPPSPLSDIINTDQSLEASLSGKLDDYIIRSTKEMIYVEAKRPYQERYRTAARAEERLEQVEKELSRLGDKVLRQQEELLRQQEELLKLKEYTEFILVRSQTYTRLLSILQFRLFHSLPFNLQHELRNDGLANLPLTFAIWWIVWNNRDPIGFPLPAPLVNYTPDPDLLAFTDLLLDPHGGESRSGITVRKAWDTLDSVTRDLMLYCWSSKKGATVVRNNIAHPDTTRSQAAKLLGDDLCGDLYYLHACAMWYVSSAPETFK